jgi:hypothetical protein
MVYIFETLQRRLLQERIEMDVAGDLALAQRLQQEEDARAED